MACKRLAAFLLCAVFTLVALPGAAQEPVSQSSPDDAAAEKEAPAPPDQPRRRVIEGPIRETPALKVVHGLKLPFRLLGAGLDKGLQKAEQDHVIVQVQDLQESLSRKGYEPLFGGLGTGSGFSFGVNISRERFLGTSVRLDIPVQYSTNGYAGLGARLTFPIKGDRLFLATDFEYQDRPQEDFFGIGPDSSEENRTNFELEKRSFKVTLGSQLRKGLRVGVRTGLMNANVGPGTDNRFPDLQSQFDVTLLPGGQSGAELFSVGPYLEWDYRNNPADPTRGGIWRVEATYFRDTDSQDFRFMRYSVDTAHYIPLSDEHVVAVRALGIFNEERGGSSVPFFMKAVLGGKDSMRGFREFRFYDDAALLFSAEYRWRIWKHADAVLFVDEGQVAPDIGALGIGKFRNSHGIGFRFKGKRSQLFRVDVGHSNEGWRVNFSFSPAF